MDVVALALRELKCDQWFEVLDVFCREDSGWCAQLLNRREGMQQTVFVEGDPHGVSSKVLKELFVARAQHVRPMAS
jgi:hypothetical protein